MIPHETKGGNGAGAFLGKIFAFSKGAGGMEVFGLSATAVIFYFALLGVVRGRKTSGEILP